MSFIPRHTQAEMEGALSTGSTLLNLACTDHPQRGFIPGGYYYLVGDSISGKTWLSLTCFAEACRNPKFDNYRLIFDDVEGGALMDIERFFGKRVAERMEPPEVRNKTPIYSDTVESFFAHIHAALEGEQPFIYVLDSQDALSSLASLEKFRKQLDALSKGTELTGSYGDGKAKYHSEHLRHVISGLRRTGSILIIIGQTRDNLGMGFETKTRSGGRALRFYAHLEIWTSVAGKIKRMIRGQERTLGIWCAAEVKKNRLTGKIGKDRIVQIPIYYEHGIDDVGSCVQFLIDQKHWVKAEGKRGIAAPEFDFEGTPEMLIRHIEEQGLEPKLQEITAQVWHQIDEECRVQRKPRYQ